MKMAVCKPGKEASSGTSPSGALMLDFENHGKTNFCCLGYLVCDILLWQLEPTNRYVRHLSRRLIHCISKIEAWCK